MCSVSILTNAQTDADKRLKRKKPMSSLEKTIQSNWNLIFLCWLIASGSTLGSLFFSEVMELPPCSLCWYQRIFMFPLVLIFLAGLFPYDDKTVKYALPITLVGWGVAGYHLLLYAGIIPESMQPCSQGVSCTDASMELFGFVNIPLLSLLSFTCIALLLVVVKRRTST